MPLDKVMNTLLCPLSVKSAILELGIYYSCIILILFLLLILLAHLYYKLRSIFHSEPKSTWSS